MAPSTDDAKPTLLGECVVYLGVLNYFFTVDESLPVVSRLGNEIGRLQLRITPYVQGTSSKKQHLEDEFVPYARADEDSAEEQVHEFMDRNLQYRVELQRLNELASQRFSHVSLRYTFFREVSTQTPRFRIGEGGDVGPLGFEVRHVAEVSDALVKYVTSSNLSVEILGHLSG